MLEVKLNGAVQAKFGYDGASWRASLGYANGRATTWEYDAASRVVRLDHAGMQG